MLINRVLLAATACVCLQGCEAIPLWNVVNSNFLHGDPVIDDHVWLLDEGKRPAGTLDAYDDKYLPPPCQPDATDGSNSGDPYKNWQGPQIRSCIYAMRQLIDVRFYHYQDSLLAAESGGTTFADLAVVGMGAAGSVVGESTSHLLNAASGAVAGAEAKINNDVLRSKSIEIILQQMETDRATQGAIIDARLQVTPPTATSGTGGTGRTGNSVPGSDNVGDSGSPDQYAPYVNMYDAANDLYRYARAGSWTHAILELQAQTGAQAQACTKLQNAARVGLASKASAANASGQNNCPLAPPLASQEPQSQVARPGGGNSSAH